MNNSWKRLGLLFLMIGFLLSSLAGCGQGNEGPSSLGLSFDENGTYEEILEQAKGSTVTFYGWGGDEDRNQWLDQVVAPVLKEKYDITLERVPMDIDQILAKLTGEKEACLETGSIDMIWINGENFYSAKENGLLYGPFTEKLPNFVAYVDSSDPESSMDFGYPIEGYEAPYGKAQMVLIHDTAVTAEAPKNAAELMDFVKKYPGKVTYPALPDFTGSAFVRNIIYDIVGYEQFLDMNPDKETVRAAIEPAMEYLRSLNPYLWNQGTTFPSTSTELSNMFADGEVMLHMSYEPYSVDANIEKGVFSDTVRAFLFESGTIGNTSYIGIAQNAPHKAAAIVAINEILSPELQESQYQDLKALPVLSYDMLSEDQKANFDQVVLGEGAIPQAELLSKRLPEMSAKLVPIIEEIWEEEVVGK